MKWLIVDDSPTMRRIVKHTINESGDQDIAEANDGKQALGLCDASIDFVITDWNMPVMGGLELVKQIRANPEWASIKIIMVSGLSTKKDVVSALESGVDGYILKPFSVETLMGKVEEILGGRIDDADAAAAAETADAAAAAAIANAALTAAAGVTDVAGLTDEADTADVAATDEAATADVAATDTIAKAA